MKNLFDSLIGALSFLGVVGLCFTPAAILLSRRTYAVVAPQVPDRDYRVRVVEAVLLGEARGEGPGGVRRVAEVVRNRMILSGKTALQTVEAHKQFSCLNGITAEILLEQREGWTVPHDTREMARWCASQLVFPHGYDFGASDLVKGATYFHEAGVQPLWARGKRPVATYKRHIFYRL